MKKLQKKIAKALLKSDSKTDGYPDYDELARIAIKVVRKALRDDR